MEILRSIFQQNKSIQESGHQNRWQTLSLDERLDTIKAVVDEFKTSGVEPYFQGKRRLGGGAGSCGNVTSELKRRFTDAKLDFSRSTGARLARILNVNGFAGQGGLAGHVFGILEETYLFDLTMEQFYSDGDFVPPIVTELMQRGFVELNEENVHAYAEALAKKSIPRTEKLVEKLLKLRINDDN